MKRFDSHGKRILTPRPVPPHRLPIRASHPLIREIWETLYTRDGVTIKGTARRAGIDECTLRGWRRGTSASLANVEAVLNVLGLKLVAVPVDSMLTKNTNDVS
jgi:hypothetical protein